MPCGSAETASKRHPEIIISAKPSCLTPFKNKKFSRNLISSAPGTFNFYDPMGIASARHIPMSRHYNFAVKVP
jgi:hypothetical protein